MIGPLQAALPAIAWASVSLAAAAIVIGLLLQVFRVRSPRLHRAAWGCVLLQGVAVAHLTFDVPWYDSPVSEARTPPSADEIPDLGGLAAATAGYDDASLTQSAPLASPTWHWRRVASTIWLGGISIGLLATAASYLLLLVNLRTARRAPQSWHAEWQRLLSDSGVTTAIPLLVHRQLGPMLCRLPGRFVVVVPEDAWGEFTRQQRLAILRHELAHFERGDVWKSLVARLIALPHWFNPLAWWAVRKFEEGGEWACDQRLVEADPRQVPAYANALLAIVAPESRQVCASAARGGSLAVRLRRLLTVQPQEDSFMKRVAVTVALLCVVGFGAVRIQLVARAQEEGEREGIESVEEEMRQRIADFSRQLQDNAPLVARFRSALATPAGEIVMRDRAAHLSERLRNEARERAIPKYLSDRFVREGDTVKLRAGQEPFRDDFLGRCQTFNEDVARIADALKRMAGKLKGESEADRLMVRFANHEASAPMLYIEELRERLRPDAALIERELGELFVADQDGRFIVRASYRDRAEEHLEAANRSLRGTEELGEEMAVLAEEFSEADDFNKQLKARLTEPLFITFLGAEVFGEEADNVDERLNRFFDEFGEIAVDTADGLAVVNEESRQEIRNVLTKYERLREIAPQMRGPLDEFVAKIRDDQELEKGWRKLLASDLAIVRLAGEIEIVDGDPGQLIEDLLNEVVDKNEDGTLTVREDRHEELTEGIREMFHQYRNVRRRGRTFDKAAEQLADQELAAAFRSMGGKFVALHSIQQSLRGQDFNGLSVWVDEHFEEADGRLALREGASEELEEFLEAVGDVNRELQNDDF